VRLAISDKAWAVRRRTAQIEEISYLNCLALHLGRVAYS
jgi:hypothetical protein